jgi:hypothetical protein
MSLGASETDASRARSMPGTYGTSAPGLTAVGTQTPASPQVCVAGQRTVRHRAARKMPTKRVSSGTNSEAQSRTRGTPSPPRAVTRRRTERRPASAGTTVKENGKRSAPARRKSRVARVAPSGESVSTRTVSRASGTARSLSTCTTSAVAGREQPHNTSSAATHHSLTQTRIALPLYRPTSAGDTPEAAAAPHRRP